MLEFVRTMIGKKFCSDIAEIPSSISRLSRAVESLELQLMELNSHVQRGVSVDITSMPVLKQYDVMPILLAEGDKDGDRDNTLA
jgi:hypothetical protein